ncbi:MAG: Permease of the drug/metabolite transporter (DMT) superfamily [Ktedonobacterales bacterium]|jgi:drug/metabolite transporter (DMT)-like permease|nr:MAG: Permease of the drug/metabolite transporter (DMT) superfamily [Ktedonobacterales bacterium]
MSQPVVESAPLVATRSSIARRYGVYALLLFVVLVWGGSFVAARMILSPEGAHATALSPTLLAAVRFLLASAIFLPLLARQQMTEQRLKLADLPLFLLLGQLGISVYFWLQYTGVRLTNAGIAAVLVVGLIPLATLVVARVALRESLGARQVVALLLGVVGVGVVAGQQGIAIEVHGGFLLGALCLVADALCFAVYSTLVRGLRARYTPLTVTGGTMIAGTLGLLALAAFSGDWRTLAALSAGQWLAILYLAIVCSVLAYFCYNTALTRIAASKAAVWLYLEPVVALGLGAALLGERITLPTVAGGLVILASLYLAQRG